MELQELRIDYDLSTLDIAQVSNDPLVQLERWLQDAIDAGLPEPHAMGLSTVDASGAPSSRNLLVRGLVSGSHADRRVGLVFYTNKLSHKASDLATNPQACALFSWLGMQRQIRVSGVVTDVPDVEADEYFASRPRGTQIGAWVSNQSQPIESRSYLESQWDAANARFADIAVPRPPHWGGYVLNAHQLEFWQGRTFRLHDRIRYRLVDGDWQLDRLAP